MEPVQPILPLQKMSQLDEEKVREAVAALLAFHKKKATKSPEELFLNQSSRINLIISLWKITEKKAKTFPIKMPHPLRTPETEVCLFTKDDVEDSEETARTYQELLHQKGVTEVTQVMPLQVLKKEFKAFESRRQLAQRFDIFLVDDRIQRLMHAHLGKEFYRRKKYPHAVDLKKGNLKREILKAIDATYFILNNRGDTNHLVAGHTGMTLDQVVENIMAAVQSLSAIIPIGWFNIKALYLRTDKSVSLPIHTSLRFEGWETPADISSKDTGSGTDISLKDISRLKKQLELKEEEEEVELLNTPEMDAKANRFPTRAERTAQRKAKLDAKFAARKASEAVVESAIAGIATREALKRKAADITATDGGELASEDVKVQTATKQIIKEKSRVATGEKKEPGKRRAKTAKKAKAK